MLYEGGVMETTCYRIAEDGRLEEISVEVFIDPWRQGSGLYCVDIRERSQTNWSSGSGA